jgi:hypothetical protein
MEPEIFAPGIVSTGLSEAVCCFSPEGKEVYWNIAYSVKKDAKSFIVYSKIENGEWTRPEFVSFTNMKYIYMYIHFLVMMVKNCTSSPMNLQVYQI